MAKKGIIFHDFWDHFFLMVNPDHLIFGINSNVMVNGDTRREERTNTNFNFVLLLLCRKSILVILI